MRFHCAMIFPGRQVCCRTQVGGECCYASPVHAQAATANKFLAHTAVYHSAVLSLLPLPTPRGTWTFELKISSRTVFQGDVSFYHPALLLASGCQLTISRLCLRFQRLCPTGALECISHLEIVINITLCSPLAGSWLVLFLRLWESVMPIPAG